MQLLFDFFPILLFFICYKFFGIYIATAVAIGISLFQVIFHRIRHQQFEKMHLISFGLIAVLGGATLFFHNPWFIKFKPTAIYWTIALVLLGSSVFAKKNLIQKMLGENIRLQDKIWSRLNSAWVSFFSLMGALNLYIAYNFNTDFWVNFKLFGGAGLTLIFILLQALYLSRHIDKEPASVIRRS